MISYLRVAWVSVLVTVILGEDNFRVKKQIPPHYGYNDVEYNFESFDKYHHHLEHFPHYHAPPAISTVSYITTHHSKPVSYSGFTNHGRGHHDPGYSVEFSSHGFHHGPIDDHDHHHIDHHYYDFHDHHHHY